MLQQRNDPSYPYAYLCTEAVQVQVYLFSLDSPCRLSPRLWFMRVGQDSGKKPWHSLKIDASPLSEGQKSSFSTLQHLLDSPTNLFLVFKMIWFKPENPKLFLLLLLLFCNILIVSSLTGIPQVDLITWWWSKLSVCWTSLSRLLADSSQTAVCIYSFYPLAEDASTYIIQNLKL